MRRCNCQPRTASGGSLQITIPPLTAARRAMTRIGSGVQGSQERRCPTAAAGGGSPPYKDRVQNLFKQRSKAYDTNNTFHPPLCQHLVQLAGISPGANPPGFALAPAYPHAVTQQQQQPS